MAVKHIVELFALDGRDFITEAYRNLLKREPDEHGLMYYLGRLAQGHSKAAVIAQLAKSSECRPLEEILGLKNLMVEVQRSKKLFWRWCGRHAQVEGAVYTGMIKLAEIDTQLARMNQHLGSLEESMKKVEQMKTDSLVTEQLQDKLSMEESMKKVEQMKTDSLVTEQLQDKLSIENVDDVPERVKSIYLRLKLAADKNNETTRL